LHSLPTRRSSDLTLCKTSILASDIRNPPRGYPCRTLNFCLYKPCAMCLSWLPFQPCAGSEPDCNCCLSNKYTYMQLRSPEVSRVNFHLSVSNSITEGSSKTNSLFSTISHYNTFNHIKNIARVTL